MSLCHLCLELDCDCARLAELPEWAVEAIGRFEEQGWCWTGEVRAPLPGEVFVHELYARNYRPSFHGDFAALKRAGRRGFCYYSNSGGDVNSLILVRDEP